VIESARLNLYYYAWWDNDPAGRRLSLHRLLSDWSEETLQWCNLPDRSTTESARATVPGSFGWMQWDVTADVQAYVNGTSQNHGWFLTDPNAWNMYNIPQTWFRSRQHANLRPYLDVVIGGGTPVELQSWGRVKSLFR